MDYNINKIATNEEILEALDPVPNFTSRDDIKPWIHENLDPRGISLVIERSDASKVVFKCKNLHRKSSAPRTTTTKIVNGKPVLKRVRRSIPEDSCPFRLRVSYSVKYKNWSVNIIKHEHNLSLCSNFGLESPLDHDSVAAANAYGNQRTRPGLSQKRSYYSSTTPSPNYSSYANSPVLSSSTTNTPHEFLDYEPSFKKPKHHDHSPLFNEIDPLDSTPLELSSLPRSLQNSNLPIDAINLHDDLNFIYAGGSASDALAGQNTDDLSTDPLSDNFPFSNDAMIKTSLANSLSSGTNSTTSNSIFENAPIHDDGSNTHSLQLFNNDFEKLYNSSLHLQGTSTHSNNNSLNIKQEEIQDNDPLMYLLSSTNSNYSFEELENLDKAMGIDANDKILMSMFQGI
ncbi:hypothetical protein WICANDRAFT_64419 [Wickerhamomyces anomalus NRRL Y-366-8]|uniref:Uncharacterized protein n=1 Tax=Wickerhamomyces anomalus (strain ATCC 58044 / CBS 1984 / NCYC 433 / NRRL Y-366-8) TaxID=683960 RepID=A0A1E3NZ34_WICAA|nr:uncharacterized protein WICANDRAFT_64419 [Wickerhamomyces anomalus NRRL Y-366-8]ODQ58280.1 hypothetical protein WICANDRAFT_64419 [Wickerhamomyces anomalus NRRL Y-366-8]